MSDVSYPGDVSVYGQRRWPGGAFPVRAGTPDEPGGTHQNEVSEDPNAGPSGPPDDPCGDPTGKREWNADAAAAEALRQIRAAAALVAAETGVEDQMYRREFGAQLYERADGSIYVGPVTWGDPQTGTFNFDESQATQGNLIGEVHSHPSPSRWPSVADYGRMNAFSDWTGRNFRSYIISRDETDNASDFALRVYDKSSNQHENTVGPEVNPDGQPCP